MEDMINDYIRSKTRYDGVNLSWNINVIYTAVSNLKSVLHTGDEKIRAYVYSKIYYTQVVKDIVLGSANIIVCDDDVHVAMFENF